MNSQLVVADSGPLITLARINRLELLPALYERITIPEQVRREVTEGAASGRVGASAVAAASWIEVGAVDHVAADGYALLVDRGEAEAIAMARSRPDTLLLIDDARGRRLALRLGVRIKGTLGILVAAKRRGLLEVITPELDSLPAHGIYVARDLVAAAKREAGE